MKSIQPIRPSPAPRARARSSLSSLLSPPALRFTTAGEPPDGADAVDCVCLGVLAQVTMPGRITQRMKAPTALPWRRGTGSPPRHQGDAARGRPSPPPRLIKRSHPLPAPSPPNPPQPHLAVTRPTSAHVCRVQGATAARSAAEATAATAGAEGCATAGRLRRRGRDTHN